MKHYNIFLKIFSVQQKHNLAMSQHSYTNLH